MRLRIRRHAPPGKRYRVPMGADTTETPSQVRHMKLIVCFLMLVLSGAFGKTKDITPCDFRQGTSEGKQISVRGIMFFTMHGFTLTAQDSCNVMLGIRQR